MDNKNLCFLDEFRLRNGNNNLTKYFRNLALYDSRNSAVLLNDEKLHYGTFFELRHEIEQFGLFNSMSMRNKFASVFTSEIISGGNKASKLNYPVSDYIQAASSSLKWMLETGASDDGLSSEYDRVMDITSAYLISVFNDRTILPAVAEMIFKRHKKGYLIHDLVWSFFECKDPGCLTLLANYLSSSDPDDLNLAEKLLGVDNIRDREQQYVFFMDWIRENSPYLYFSGENFQQSGSPKPFTVVMSGKYLCSSVSPCTGRILRQLSQEEKKLLTGFNGLDHKSQILMADYSYTLYHKDKNLWNTWLSMTLEEQIKQATEGGIS